MIDVSFDNATINTLQSLIGRRFDLYSNDPFIFTPTALGIVGCKIAGNTYRFTAELQVIERFFNADDVAVFKFEACEPREISSRMDGGKLIDTPVEDTISAIDIINDHECVTHNKVSRELRSTKGVIFHLASGHEISYELGTWFSEMITIQRGYNLIEKFTPVADFYEEWDVGADYVPQCSREVITLR